LALRKSSNNHFSKLSVTVEYGRVWIMGKVVMVEEIVFIKKKGNTDGTDHTDTHRFGASDLNIEKPIRRFRRFTQINYIYFIFTQSPALRGRTGNHFPSLYSYT
jgi:hypothetical protein